jgi:hypothetical protein
MKTRLNGAGILPLVCVLLAALALVCVSCTGAYINPDAGGGGASTSEIINGFYGVTSDGKTIEIVITSQSSKSVLSSRSASNWSTGDHYFITIDRIKVSSGTITVTATNGSITFSSTDGSSVSSINITAPGAITIRTSGGTQYSGKVVEAKDYYYCIGAPTDASEATIKGVLNGKTPEQVYNYCSTTGTYLFFEYPETFAGTWEDILVWAGKYNAPPTVIKNVHDELFDNGKVSAVGYYYWNKEGFNIMFYVAKVPLF